MGGRLVRMRPCSLSTTKPVATEQPATSVSNDIGAHTRSLRTRPAIRALTAGRQLAAGWTAGGVGQLSHETMAGETRSMMRRQRDSEPSAASRTTSSASDSSHAAGLLWHCAATAAAPAAAAAAAAAAARWCR